MGQILCSILKLLGLKSSTSKCSRDDTQTCDQYQELPEECCIDVIIDRPNPNPNPPPVDAIINRYNPNLSYVIIGRPNLKPNPKPPLVEATDSDFAKTIGPYNSFQKILLVGEGDFSFSASLAVAFGSASNMIATSLNSFEYLSQNYRRFCSNMSKLVTRGCIVLHGIDATQMATHPQLSAIKFDCIVFNFPHSGFPSDGESRHSEMGRHQKLVSGFLRNAKKMITENGEIHIRHKCNGFFLKWNISKLASNQGLFLVQESYFVRTMFPGYYTKYGFGGDKNFNCNPSKTYIFGLMHY